MAEYRLIVRLPGPVGPAGDVSLGQLEAVETAMIAADGALDTRATTLEGRATTLEGRATAVEGRATTLEGQATALEGRATALEGETEALAAADVALDARVDPFEEVIDPEAPGDRVGIVGALRRWLGFSVSNDGVTIGRVSIKAAGEGTAEAHGDGRGWLWSRRRNDGSETVGGVTTKFDATHAVRGVDGRGWSPFGLSNAGFAWLFGLGFRHGFGRMGLSDPRGWKLFDLDRFGTTRIGGMTLRFNDGPWIFSLTDSHGWGCFGITRDGVVKFRGSDTVVTTATIVAEPVISTDIYMRDDQVLPLYVRNIIEERTDSPQVRCTFWSYDQPIGSPYIVEADDVLEIDPARCTTTAQLLTRAVNQAIDTRHVVELNIRKADTSGAGSPTVLMIGDSITNAGMADLVKRRLNAWDYTPTFVGTVEGADYLATTGSDADGPLGEARTGRMLAHLTFRVDDADVQPLAVGQEAFYLGLTKSQRLAYNPALRLAEVGDDPLLVQNGYVFDLAFYLDRFALTPPTIVVLGLGTNDWRDITGEPLTERMLADLAIVVPQIRAALPSATILIWQPTFPRAEIRDAVFKEGPRRVQQATIKYVRELGDANVFVVPVWASVTQEAGYLLNDAATIDPETGVLTADIDDSIHPFTIARGQIADVLAAAIAFHS